MVHNSDIQQFSDFHEIELSKEFYKFRKLFVEWKAPLISHDSEFSRIINYFQLTHWSFRKNQYSLVEKVYIVLQENETKYMLQVNVIMKDHISELRRKIWRHDWSSRLHTQLKQLWNLKPERNSDLNGILFLALISQLLKLCA